MVTGPLHDASGGHPALDFVNTVDRTVGKPWVDRLTSYQDLLTWSFRAGTLASGTLSSLRNLAGARPAEAAAVLTRVRGAREGLYRILAASVAEEDAQAADLELLNVELARALAHARIESGEGGFAWSWELDAQELDLALWPLLRSAAELLTSAERTHVKRCASETCLWLFLDRTKNHARRWCDMKVCGNRDKVRRHRRRARQA